MSSIIFILIGSLAIRINNKLLITWLVLLLRYYHRESFYVFNKNQLIYRDKNSNITPVKLQNPPKNIRNKHRKIYPQKKLLLDNLINNPMIYLSFKNTKKRGWYVNIYKK